MKLFLNWLELAPSFCWFFLGVLAGAALDFLWWKTGISKYEERIEVFEHYHWGLTLLIFMKTLLKFNGAFLFLAGTGIAFILAEITQDPPFPQVGSSVGIRNDRDSSSHFGSFHLGIQKKWRNHGRYLRLSPF